MHVSVCVCMCVHVCVFGCSCVYTCALDSCVAHHCVHGMGDWWEAVLATAGSSNGGRLQMIEGLREVPNAAIYRAHTHHTHTHTHTQTHTYTHMHIHTSTCTHTPLREDDI